MKLLLSFNKKSSSKSAPDTGVDILDMITNAIGIALIDIDEAPLAINTPSLNNAFDSVVGIIDKLKKHYTNELKSLILPLIGSIGILGSPVSFFQRISNGV